jgi:hypothetical protein
MFRYFDKDQDGFLDFDDFLFICMPNDCIQKRAEIGQREKYLTENGLLPDHIEFELSRLLEK